MMPIEDTIREIAERLEAEAPYETCSKLLNHTGWVDVVRTIKDTCPDAFLAMVQTYLVHK